MPSMLDESTDERKLTCPTCGARQEWAEQCRRCRCDFALLQAAWHTGHYHRSACLRQLGAGQFRRAREHAARYAEAFPGQEAWRLIAVCNLLVGNWHDALVWSRRAVQA